MTRTAAEVVEGIDLTGKRAIVTGAALGHRRRGPPRALAGAGAAVTLAGPATRATGEKVAAEIRSGTGNDGVAVAPLELVDSGQHRCIRGGLGRAARHPRQQRPA